MTMPPLADVKAAAEHLADKVTSAEIQNLAAFALAVLNAPGMTDERLQQITELESKASAAPWLWDIYNDMPENGMNACAELMCEAEIPSGETTPEGGGVLRCEWDERDRHGLGRVDDPRPKKEDQEFIADARQAVPELLAEVLRLRSQR